MCADAQEDPAHRAGGRRAAFDGRSCRPRRWPAWPRRVGGVRSRPHPRSPGIACAVQGPCRWPSPHPQAAPPGDELARVGRQLASARELDGLVHGGGGRGLARGAAHDPGRAALVLAPGDPDGADLAHRVSSGAAPDRRADRLHPPPLLGLGLAVPDHTTLNRRAATLRVPRPRAGTGPLQLLVDSTGLRLGGPGEWLVEKHGAKTRRSWRKLHLGGVDAGTGRIEAVELTGNETDDGARVGPWLDQVEAAPLASFTGDGA